MAQLPHLLEPSEHRFEVAVLTVDLLLHGCDSLKDKRGRLARVTKRLTKKHPVVVTESGDHDIWRRAALSAVTIAGDRNLATRILEAVADTLMQEPDVELLRHEIEYW